MFTSRVSRMSRLVSAVLICGGVVGYIIRHNILIQHAMQLPADKKVKFARIIFEDEKEHKMKVIDQLSIDQLEMLRSLYAQKITFETINSKIPDHYVYEESVPAQMPTEATIWSGAFFLCYPEHSRQMFNINNTIFVKRALYPLLFWKNQFFSIAENYPESYGLLWMLMTYALVLMIASSLTHYYIEPINYKQDYDKILTAFATVYIFKLIEPALHSSAMSCMGNLILTEECQMISSYSLTIYLLPTIFCMVPSIYFRWLLMLGEGILRVTFLYRNYCTKVEARSYIMLILLIFLQAISLFVTYNSLFATASLGFGFSEGFSAVFNTTPTPEQQVESSQNGDGTANTTHLLLSDGLAALYSRHFRISNHNLRHFFE